MFSSQLFANGGAHAVFSLSPFHEVHFWDMGNWRRLKGGAQVTCFFPPRRVEATGFFLHVTVGAGAQESLASRF